MTCHKSHFPQYCQSILCFLFPYCCCVCMCIRWGSGARWEPPFQINLPTHNTTYILFLSVVSNSLVTPWAIQSMEFPRPECWSGQPFPSLGYLSNPGIEPRSPALQADSLPAEPAGKTKNTGVAFPFSRVSSQPRNQTAVSCIAG